MKKTNLLLALACSFVQLTAQSKLSYEDLKKENEYLRNALSLNKPVTEWKDGELRFSIVKVEGNRKNQLVTIELMVENRRRNIEAFAARVMPIVDINGMDYPLQKGYIGFKDATIFAFTDLRKNTPIKCKYIFKGVQPDVKMLRAFNCSVEYHIPGDDAAFFQNITAEFKDLNILWK